MSRYFIELSYKGTAYCGWQRQPSSPSVQQTIEESLSKLFRRPIAIMGAGRTDTGVHASFYIAHFEAEDIDTSAQKLYHLNCILPHDIAISAMYEVDPDMHARFNAHYREYKYYIQQTKNPFNIELAWLLTTPLDIHAMQRGADLLLEYEDFTSLCRLHSDNKTNICHITKAQWSQQGDQLIFTVGADRFLRGMVRAIVGTLVDVGRGKRSVEDFRTILDLRNRSAASAAAPAQGLFLTDVKYK